MTERAEHTAFTPGPWFVSGVRFKMNGGEWHSINRYDDAKKKDENVACVGFDPQTGDGWADARLIASAPDLLAALRDARTVLGMMINPASIETTTSMYAYAQAVEAEAMARAAISKATGEA